ncbi:MAG TPA: hypothetical protein VKX45_12755 [Bryobacteraceae bacterium]|jgi:hypothetical protein|nr:hypothetical protein [Bryobacteraceae bacterium]
MRQGFHIFKKDVRHLWIEIAVALAAAGLFAFIHTHAEFWQNRARIPQTIAGLLASFLLPVSWVLLIVRAIHGETLTGDREFWLTRPYHWRSLLAAKLRFVVLFVNLPVLAAQAVILQAHGFDLSAELAPLLWNQALLTAAVFLPVAAIAALTTGIVQCLLVGLVALAGTLLLTLGLNLRAVAIAGEGWGAMEWVHTDYALLIVAIAASAILFWQYSKRRTVAGRAGAGAAMVILVLGTPVSWRQAFAIQSWFSQQAAASAIHVRWNSGFQWMTRALIRPGQGVTLNVPLEIAGVAEGLAAKPEGLTFSIERPGGIVWRAEGPQNVTVNGQLVALRSTIDESLYWKVKDQRLTLRGNLYLTLYGNRHDVRVPVNGGAQAVPGIGRCTAVGRPALYFLTCYSALRPRAARMSVMFEPHPRVLADYTARFVPSYSPFPAELSIDPLVKTEAYSTYAGQLDAVTVSTEEPVAWVRAPLEIGGIRLGAYEATLK